MQQPRRRSCVSLLVAVSLCTQACARNTSVSGQVFVTVNVGSSIKLGGVEVLALSRADLAGALEKTLDKNLAEISRLRRDVAAADAASTEARKKVDALQAQLFALSAEQKAPHVEWMYSEAQREAIVAVKNRNEAVERAANWPTVESHFASLPKPIAAAVTNADGVFSIVVPTRERFALAVHATRRVGGTEEEYYWLIWVDPREKNDSILVTNRNLINHDKPESLLTTWAEAIQKP